MPSNGPTNLTTPAAEEAAAAEAVAIEEAARTAAAEAEAEAKKAADAAAAELTAAQEEAAALAKAAEEEAAAAAKAAQDEATTAAQTAEEEAAEFLASEKKKGRWKPTAGFIAGRTAPKGRRMGHAGAIISAAGDSAAEKSEIMRSFGLTVAPSAGELGSTVASVLARL